MPLVNRAGLRNVFVQSAEPSEWNQGCVWSDTDNANLFKNVCGTATEIGGAVSSCTTVMVYCQTNGNYTSPCSAAASSTAAGCTPSTTDLGNNTTGSDASNANAGQITGLPACESISALRACVSTVGCPAGTTSLAVYTCCGCVPDALLANGVSAAITCTGIQSVDISASCVSVPANGIVWIANTQTQGSTIFRFCNTNSRSVDTCISGCCFANPWVEASTSCLRPALGITVCVPDFAASNAVNCCNCNAWRSASVCNPNITVDLGAPANITSILLRRGACDAVTTYEIRASLCCPPGACDVIRTVTAACLTADTDRFVRFNVQNARFVMVRATDACAAIAEFNNIKVETATVCELARESGRLCISTTCTAIGLCGS